MAFLRASRFCSHLLLNFGKYVNKNGLGINSSCGTGISHSSLLFPKTIAMSPCVQAEAAERSEDHAHKSRKSFTPLKKLHKRVFTKEEQAENDCINHEDEQPSERDSFGTLQRNQKRCNKSMQVSSVKGESDVFGSLTDQQEQLWKKSHISSTGSYHSSGDTDWNNDKLNSAGRRGLGVNEKTFSFRNTRNKWADTFGTLQEEGNLAERAKESVRSTVGTHEERCV
jgi:hypothetical protein